MAEYIDRDKLLLALKEWQNTLIETYGKNDEYVRCLESVFTGIENAHAADVRPAEWIPVTERLPDNEDEVVVAFKGSADGEWWYRIDNFVDGVFCYNTAFGRNITHWMPLPEPPKEEE